MGNCICGLAKADDTIIRPKRPAVSIPNMAFADCVMADFDKYGDSIALVDGMTGAKVSFRELKKQILECTAGLKARGFQKGDVLALYAPNCLEWPVLFFAVLRCGGVVTTLNPAYGAQELSHQLKDSKAVVFATTPELLKTANAGVAALPGQVKEFIVLGKPHTFTDFLREEFTKHISFHDILKPGDDAAVPVKPAEDLAVLPYSSGTTGLPKGVMLTHANLVANLSQMSGAFQIGPQDAFCAVLPFFHIYGMTVILALGLKYGSKTVVMPKFDPPVYMKNLKEHKVTVAHVAPPLVNFMAKHPAVEAFLPLPHLKELFCGAAPLGHDLALAAKERLRVGDIRQGYGMTEMSPASHASNFGSKKFGSIGGLVGNMECKLVSVDTGKALTNTSIGPENVGELWLRGPNIMKGYLANPQATKDTIDADGFIHTGDVGWVDEDGDFTLTDRLKELIKVKGFQVAPAELEDLLMTHPKIKDAAVIGVAALREGDGQVPKAYVVRSDEGLTAEAVMEFVQQSTVDYKHVKYVQFIETVPKSASGKILRKDLRAMEKKKTFS